jgi:hypothetical protein
MVALPVFASGFGLVLFDTTYSLWIISELFGAVLIPRLRQRGATRVKRDRGSAALVILTIFVSISIAFAFGYAGIGMLPDWIFYLGIALMFLGILVRQWAIAILGRFFSLTVQIAEDHKVVEKGPIPACTPPLVHRGPDHVHWTGLGSAVCRRALSAAYPLQYFIRIPNARGGADVVVRAGTGLCQLHEKDETAHTVPHLNRYFRSALLVIKG